MLGYIWLGMIAVSLVCSLFTGRIEQLSAAVTQGADKGVRLLISMAGVMCLWTGIMKIADKSGVTAGIAKLLRPVLSRLMPDYPADSEAIAAVSANITANFLGLGNAATPLGIKAMKEMQKKNRLGDRANSSMIMFVVINTASIQLIPTTCAALRAASGSTVPYSILPHVWIASAASLAVGIAAAKAAAMTGRKKNG